MFNNEDNIGTVITGAIRMANAFNSAQRNTFTNLVPKVRPMQLEHWVALNIPTVKLNTNVVSKGNPGRAGGGGVFRDSTCSFVRAFTFFVGLVLRLLQSYGQSFVVFKWVLR